MTTFSTSGLMAIGIASAIGFVFALSFLGNNTSTLTEEQQREESFLLTSQLKQTNDQPAADAQEGMPEASLMIRQEEDLRPILTSITALKSDRETIGEVVPQMKFETNKPVLIQANLINPSETDIRQNIIILGIKSADDGSDEQLINFQGDLAGNGNTTLELYWSPDRAGNYSIVLFSLTPNDLASAEPTKPIAEIPVKVS